MRLRMKKSTISSSNTAALSNINPKPRAISHLIVNILGKEWISHLSGLVHEQEEGTGWLNEVYHIECEGVREFMTERAFAGKMAGFKGGLLDFDK